ncbi:recombinase family protein [Rhizobium leguminosarum]|uniref:recombinase family protein n=1 Tax=Rhizobium leguminosarum TaxID=384 RepID=UPI0028A8B721|nr:recombinase family protein [Rhizobium leguminosarum]
MASDLLNIVNELKAKDVELLVLDQSIDTSSPAGRAMLQMLAVFAEFETAIRAERQVDGIAKAKENGTKFGRKPQATDDVVSDICRMRAEGLLIKDIMKATGLSKATAYRALGGVEGEQQGVLA